MSYTFVRHTESNYNRNGDPYEFDSPLTEEGRLAAPQLVGRYDYALISFMGRTRETFQLSGLDAPIIEYSSLCRERFNVKGNLSSLLCTERNVREKKKDFQFRMSLLKAYLQYLSETHKHILIVTHQGVIAALTSQHHAANGEMIHVNKLL